MRSRWQAARLVGRFFSIGFLVWLGAGRVAAEPPTPCPPAFDGCTALLVDERDLGEDWPSVSRGELNVSYREVSNDDGDPALITTGDRVIDAPLLLVWSVLTDFETWPRFLPSVETVELEPTGADHWRVRGHSRAIGMRFTFATLRSVDPRRRLVWEHLDPSRRSDFADMASFWQLLPVAEDRTLVRLHTRIEPGFYIPGFLRRRVLGSSVPGSLDALAAEVARQADLAVAAR